jgi:hypothetical protein
MTEQEFEKLLLNYLNKKAGLTNFKNGVELKIRPVYSSDGDTEWCLTVKEKGKL